MLSAFKTWKKLLNLNMKPPFSIPCCSEVKTPHRTIYDFMASAAGADINIDLNTVQSFGEEWQHFHHFTDADLQKIGDLYFDVMPPEALNPKNTIAIDFGCGSGRFMKYLQGRIKHVVGIDPSDAVFAADHLLGKTDKVSLCRTSIGNIPFSDNTFDFGYSLGVLHHIPDTRRALHQCIQKIKPGGFFLLYLYYNLDNRGSLYRAIYRCSNLLRRLVSRLPQSAKQVVCASLALVLYMPFVFASRLLHSLGLPKSVREKIPLHFYEDQSFYIIRNDALDRFGTPLEQRFSRKEIEQMMLDAGLSKLIFSENAPYWHVVGQKNDNIA